MVWKLFSLSVLQYCILIFLQYYNSALMHPCVFVLLPSCIIQFLYFGNFVILEYLQSCIMAYFINEFCGCLIFAFFIFELYHSYIFTFLHIFLYYYFPFFLLSCIFVFVHHFSLEILHSLNLVILQLWILDYLNFAFLYYSIVGFLHFRSFVFFLALSIPNPSSTLGSAESCGNDMVILVDLRMSWI